MAALPETYALALELRGQGLSPAEMAARIDVPIEALETVICLAEAKLASLGKRARAGEPTDLASGPSASIPAEECPP